MNVAQPGIFAEGTPSHHCLVSRPDGAGSYLAPPLAALADVHRFDGRGAPPEG